MTKKKKSAGGGGEQATRQPWYQDGLRFECTQCGDCCTGEPGNVWVDEGEIVRLAARMEMEVDKFESKFVRQVGVRKSLVEYPDGDCIFLDPKTRGCSVYEERPVQCRTWPFWNSTITSRRAWRETCEICPGSGVGRLYSIEEIEQRRLERDV
ncbi:YkgJ family cysteine cluster protein [Planctomycetaceae bacterium SH139]